MTGTDCFGHIIAGNCFFQQEARVQGVCRYFNHIIYIVYFECIILPGSYSSL